MKTTHQEIVEYWSRHQDECGLSVDWSEAEELCWRCTQKRSLQRCHIVPHALGGSEEPNNLVLLCSQCHAEAPNVADSEFMWTWLRSHAVSFYGSYWYSRGLQEFEFIYGRKPLSRFFEKNESSLLPKLNTIISKYMNQTNTHWGQGQINPATIAWLLRQVEIELENDTSINS
ncbi:HNH endonuclease signature motif containing protein [Candidatus Albibeggiatoa sp. nov. NOAA]|uniref:HNH endonuclease n=1 Tax=Candidatus Albibeggiatoa sp. nov. NOAA TaxID=3162724 RepID=UPI0032F40392|nr:HNH endonuclease [Thiotrichaceae bacterium]